MTSVQIGVLSDTHLSTLNDMLDLATFLREGPFRDVDALFHAGDLVNPDFLTLFDSLPIYAVRGNCDPADDALPTRRTVAVGAYQIGLIHGWGDAATIEDWVQQQFAQEPVDAIVYGHSHAPVCHWRGAVLMFNPGSATDRRQAAFHTVGKLTLNEQGIEGQILRLPW